MSLSIALILIDFKGLSFVKPKYCSSVKYNLNVENNLFKTIAEQWSLCM